MQYNGYLAGIGSRLAARDFLVVAPPPDLPLGLVAVRDESWGRLVLALPAAPAVAGEDPGRERLVQAGAAWMRNMRADSGRACYLVLVFPFGRRVEDRLSAAVRALQQEAPDRGWGVIPWVADLEVELVDRHSGFPRVDDAVAQALVEPDRGREEEAVRREAAPRMAHRAPLGLDLSHVPSTRLILAVTIAYYLWTVLQSGSLNNLTSGANGETLFQWGANYGPAVAAGENWRLLSHVLLHGGLLHLGMNMWVLWSVGRHVEMVYGSGRMLFIYLAAGVAGGYASAVIRPEAVLSVGASGAVLGLMGALVYFGYSLRGRNVDWQRFLGPVAINLFYGFFIGGIDNYAHVGGFIGGLLAAFVAGMPGERGGWRPAAMGLVAAGLALVLSGVVRL